MGELFKIQNDVLFACMIISFIALVIAGFKISADLIMGKEVDDKLINWVGGIAIVLGFSYMLSSFLN